MKTGHPDTQYKADTPNEPKERKMKTKTTSQHEEQYWHIPKLALLPVLGIIIFTLLAYGNYFIIDKQVVSYAFSCQDNCNKLVVHDLINIYPIIGTYILIALDLISLVAMFKKGYKNLKSIKEEGLISGLIIGLIIGLIMGLIGGLIGGLTVCLIIGLIFGLIGGLIGGLIIGLIGEFTDEN